MRGKPRLAFSEIGMGETLGLSRGSAQSSLRRHLRTRTVTGPPHCSTRRASGSNVLTSCKYFTKMLTSCKYFTWKFEKSI
jgi:hypothetical protein